MYNTALFCLCTYYEGSEHSTVLDSVLSHDVMLPIMTVWLVLTFYINNLNLFCGSCHSWAFFM